MTSSKNTIKKLVQEDDESSLAFENIEKVSENTDSVEIYEVNKDGSKKLIRKMTIYQFPPPDFDESD